MKSESDQNKPALNITYYLVFQNVRNISEELDILLMQDEEHKNAFWVIPVIGFLNGKSLNGHLIRAKLSLDKVTGRSESCRKRNCLVYDFICNTDTFSANGYVETFKIQSGVLNCNSDKVIYLLKCRIYGKDPYVNKAKRRNLVQCLIIIKAHTGPMEKKT